MIKVRDGHLDTLGLLFARYKKPLFGFFYGMNRDAELSEDLVQNVFYRILKYRYLFRGDGDFKTWMFHIARNVNHDNFRKNKIRQRLDEDKREILLLSKFEEKKYKEIGEILGCSEGAVKVKVFRALQELKTIYTQLEKHL
jgi:DNA-directed RNA polymerase specialized sigma24 family protein